MKNYPPIEEDTKWWENDEQNYYPPIEKDIKWWENNNHPAIEKDILWEDDDDSMQIDADEQKDYESRVRAKVSNLKHRRNVINRKLFDKNKYITIPNANSTPEEKELYEKKMKEYHEMEKDSNYLDSYIDALERKIELEFQPLPKPIRIYKPKSKSKPKPKPKPVININPVPIVNVNPVPIRVHEEYEIPNGLLGVQRNLFNKLAAHPWAQDDDLQQRYGISKGDLYFKDYFLFKKQRAQKLKPIPWKDHFASKQQRARIPPK
jgi:hypothetical protein